MPQTGSCLCGAAKFSFATPVSAAIACHCGMCRKWSGGILASVEVPAAEMTIEQGDTIKVYPSSDWGERAFCAACGSGLWFRLESGSQPQTYYVNMGTLDDTSGVSITHELFIDEKPEGYALAGAHECITGAQFFAMIEQDKGSV